LRKALLLIANYGMKKIVLPLLLALSQSTLGQDQALPRRVTNVSDAYPVESPDGKKIVFQSNRTGNWEIFTMNSDGTELKQLTHEPAADNTPSWSPDGKRIVFVSERNGKEYDSEVYIMNADGGNQIRLTAQIGDDSHPKFTPDGKRIIFNSARSTPDLSQPWSKQWVELFFMDTDGKNVRQITSFKTISTFPSVSPNGQKILYRKVIDGPAFNWDLSQNVNNRNSEIFVMDVDGSNDSNISKSAAFDGWPAWSPDGKMIVFASNRSGPANTGQLFVTNANGKNLRQVSNGPGSFVQPGFTRKNSVYAYQVWEGRDYEYGNIVEISVGGG
jgi:TolB protein